MTRNVPRENACLACGARQRRSFTYRGFDYYRCIRCGLVSTLPFPAPEQIEEHYKKRFADGNYQLLLSDRSRYSRVYADFVGVLEALLSRSGESLAGKTVLDIGCFAGDLLAMLRDRGADVWGVELQADAVAIANRQLPGRVLQSDVYCTEFPVMQFDIVTFTGLIEHLLDPARFLARVHALVRPGGLILLQTPDSGSLLARVLRKFWPPYAPVEHIHLFTRRGIRLLLEANGFRILDTRSHWKKLPVSYVYNMLQNFGPEFHRLLKPLYSVLPRFVRNAVLPFYIGEMIVVAARV